MRLMKSFFLVGMMFVITGVMTPSQAQTKVYKSRDLSIPSDLDAEKVKDAGNVALEELLRAMLAKSDLPKKFAILPLERDVDSDYFTMQIRNYFTNLGAQNGYELYTRNDAQWNQILEEIQWGDQYGDTMDAETVQKFGRIQGVQGLIMGRVSSISKDEKGEPVVRVTIQAFEVETGRQLWGNEVKGVLEQKPTNDPVSPLISQVPGGWFTILGVLVGLGLLLVVLRLVSSAARPR